MGLLDSVYIYMSGFNERQIDRDENLKRILLFKFKKKLETKLYLCYYKEFIIFKYIFCFILFFNFFYCSAPPTIPWLQFSRFVDSFRRNLPIQRKRKMGLKNEQLVAFFWNTKCGWFVI